MTSAQGRTAGYDHHGFAAAAHALFFAIVLSFALLAAAARAAAARSCRCRLSRPAPSWSRPASAGFITCSTAGSALRFPVGVGRAGMAVARQRARRRQIRRPAWAPPPEIRARQPASARVIPGGAPNNPMGVAALTMRGGEYAIHGTNNPRLDRRLRLARLHPHVQQRHPRALSPGGGRHAGHRRSKLRRTS